MTAPLPTSLLRGPLRRFRPPGRPRPTGPAEPTGPTAGLAASGLAAGFRAGALGLLALASLVIIGWATAAPSDSHPGTALRTAGQVWLVAHHVPLAVPGGTLGLAPLGLVALPAGLLVGAGRRAGRAACPGSGRDRLLLVGALGGGYSAIATALAWAARTPDVRPSVPVAALAALLLAGLAGGLGVLSAGAAGLRLPAVVGPGTRAAFAGALAAVGVLLACGGALAATALALDGGQAARLSRAVAPGVVDGLLLTLLGAALVPNAVVWAAAVAVGPGFAVGEATAVTPVMADLGAVPALPLLVALPDPGVLPEAVLAVLAAPAVAGATLAVVLLRRRAAGGAAPAGPLAGAAHAAAGGLLAGALFGLLAALSGGPLGGGRLSAVGPSPWRVGLAAGLELALVGALTGYGVLRRRR